MEEGVIKYQLHWKQKAPVPEADISRLETWRQRLYQHRLIGAYARGLGYGNLSLRDEEGFIITGTQTGHLPILSQDFYTKVVKEDIELNTVWCEGPVKASSEALSHAACYHLSPEIEAVFHIHHAGMWKYFMNRWPTTPDTVPYGTPAMAKAISTCWLESDSPLPFLLVMGGHAEGIIAAGPSMDEIGEALLAALERV